MPIEPLKIVMWPDPILKRPCLSFYPQEFGESLQELGDAMVRANNGLGIAAPQVGLTKRIFVMLRSVPATGTLDAVGIEVLTVPPQVKPKMEPLICINPTWDRVGEYETHEEGCQSMPGIYGPVSRPNMIRLSYQTPLDSKTVHHIELLGYDAFCAQHEIDHLDGLMFFDRMPKYHRNKVIEQWEKSQKQGRK